MFLPAGGRDRRRLLAQVCAGVPTLSWLAYSKALRFAPQLDLSVLRLNLDFVMELSVAQVLGRWRWPSLCITGWRSELRPLRPGPWPGLFCGNAPWAALYEKFTVT